MDFVSTRGGDRVKGSLQAVFNGLAQDGGLYIKESMGKFPWENYLNKDFSYAEIAAEILHLFFEDLDISLLEKMTRKAYEEKFFVDNALEVKTFKDFSVVELYHGPTAAFKDFALSILPQLLQEAREEKELYILTATSGDTGKAALEGFKDLEGIEIFVFYPTDGVSSMQKLQMMTQEGKNVHVYGVNGNFDDAQNGVKEIFQSDKVKAWAKEKNIFLSSANSINIGRLVPQVAYYVYSYINLVKKGVINKGDRVDVCVPTGNFGNILAAYYAKLLSLPFENFICASNENSVLRDFFQTGFYDSNRDLYKTTSPSMDILVSSNLERLLYHMTGDQEKVKAWMEDLKSKGSFHVDEETKKKLKDFHGYSADSKEAAEEIQKVWKDKFYLMDTHTAVAYHAAEEFRRQGNNNHILLVSTASPYKFPEAVADALGLSYEGFSQALEKIQSLTGMPISKPLVGLENREVRNKDLIDKEEMIQVIQEV